MDPDGAKIVRRYDASNRALGPVADAETRAHNFGLNKCVKQRATPLQVNEIWPRNISRARLAACRCGECEQPLLLGYGRVRTELHPLHPTQDSVIGTHS